MKKEFLEFIRKLIEANPELAKELMTENIEAMMKALEQEDKEKSELTDNGKNILTFLQNADKTIYTSKEIALDLGVSSRVVSGAMRKLVADNFVEKIGVGPVTYTLTEKGKNYVIGE